MSTYDELSIRDLQKLATERKLKTSRVKEELVDRLEAYDHRSNPEVEASPVQGFDFGADVAAVEPATPVEPSALYTPTAWREGAYLKVAFRYSGRLGEARKEYFEEQVRLHVAKQGLTAVGTPGWLFSQGAVTLYGVEVA